MNEASINKFKVGDRVIIKSDLYFHTGDSINVYGLYINNNMANYAGAIAKITDVSHGLGYNLDVDNGRWVWSDKMLESYDDKDDKKDVLDKALFLLEMTEEEVIDEYNKEVEYEKQIEFMIEMRKNFEKFCSKQYCEECYLNKYKDKPNCGRLNVSCSIAFTILKLCKDGKLSI